MPDTDLGSLFFGPNAGYVLDLYDRYQTDPATVDEGTRAFFATLGPALAEQVEYLTHTSSRNGSAPMVTISAPPDSAPAHTAANVRTAVGAATLAQAIRDLGHLAVQLDPLGSAPLGSPELEPSHYGLTDADLFALPAEAVGGPGSEGAANAAEAVSRLMATYAGSIGYDLDHIQEPDERAWLRGAIETGRFATPMTVEAKRGLLNRLTEVESFEVFLHQTYLGQKRFSIEGNDILIPVLDEIIHHAAANGTREVVLGMAHRGRLNVLTHILGKPYEAVIAAFEGGKGKGATAVDTLETFDEITGTDATDEITGDVKYHLGARLARNNATGQVLEIPLVLAPNPSHLEAVNPIVVGMARASQDKRNKPGVPPRDSRASLAILLHGDAAFPGQGVVAETLNLSNLDGYRVGGTVHIIVNNQIGYTTDWRDARSTLYASDLAKGFEIPILHVNADSAEACLTAARLAIAYRDTFGKDVLIDLVGYRRWGHNEGDEPAFTQPLLYATISKHPTARAQWATRLESTGVIATGEGDTLQKAALDKLAEIRRTVADSGATPPEEPQTLGPRREVDTAITPAQLQTYHRVIHELPDGFKPTSKLVRQWDRRAKVLDTDTGKIDWAHAEAIAFAAVLGDGTPIRLTGQDAQRGTFSQRHLVLHDATTGKPYCPLNAMPDAKASFVVYNSPLSENAAMGFEYGYCVHAPESLVLWEGQFGDFGNGAQVVIDQFIASARAKWEQEPTLVLLLPHGYEGQGPEHSSARLERFLQLVAFDNLRVANCTTAAQYFHLLRRQAALLKSDRRPLIIMTPKSLLRHPLAASTAAELTNGTFQPVLDDLKATERRDAVTRLVLCSGKVFVDLEASESRESTETVAIARVEQLAPFQRTTIRQVIERYPNLEEIVWLQEEPRNMGAWSFMEPRLRYLISNRLPINYIGRPPRASPAEGFADRHVEEQGRIVAAAFDLASTAKGRRAANGTHPAPNGRTRGRKKTETAAVGGGTA